MMMRTRLLIDYPRQVYYLYELLRHPYWTPQELARHRNRQLKRIIDHAYMNVPFWHNKLRKIGLKPSEITDSKDLNKIPVVGKEEVRKNLQQMISVKSNRERLRKLSTSGSTGQPLHFYIDREEDQHRKARHLRANISCGQRLRDKWVTVTSPSQFGEIPRLQRLLRIYALRKISVFMDVSEQLSIIEKLQPDVLEGYSSSLLLLAREIDSLKSRAVTPRIMFSGAELIDSYSRDYIERVFGTPLYDHYATIEFERMAWQCPEKESYHIDADALIMQFVDENGEEVADGESGEIVCTSLSSYAFPFIRYAIGDVGVPSIEKCVCGRSFPLMKMLEGRRDSLLRFPDGRVISPRSLTVAMKSFGGYGNIDQFRVVQRKKDFVEVLVKLKDNVAEPKTWAQVLQGHLQSILHLDDSGVNLAVSFTDRIPLDKSGKLMAVVSEVREN